MSDLAILGGKPVRKKPFPTWPKADIKKLWPVMRILKAGRWDYRGEAVARFEKEFAEYIDSAHCITTTSGTTALFLSLKALGIGPGDEVLVPAYTYIATPSAVTLTGAAPVFVDIDPFTANINVEDAAQKISSRTKAVIPVHFAGLPADLHQLKEIADKREINVVEDAAHAAGAKIGERKAGSFGEFGCFSFSNKPLAGIGGGAILTSNHHLANLAFSYHNLGRPKGAGEYGFKHTGGNFRMTEPQAAMLLAGLESLGEETEKRIKNGLVLTYMLRAFDFLDPIGQTDDPQIRRAYYVYPMRYKKEALDGIPRDVFLRALRAEGIPATPGYRAPLDAYDIFKIPASPCLQAEKLCEEAIWLPQNLLLGAKKDIMDIAEAIAKIYKNSNKLKAVDK